MPAESAPTDPAGFERFQAELTRLVVQFEKNFALYQRPTYDEASVRQEFLNPLFRALGWDVENRRGLIPQHREVEVESRTAITGRQKRADYLFRTDRTDRFILEAKKPHEKLHAGYAFQAKRYAWNKGLVLALLSDFEEMKVFLVGARPHPDDGDTGHWKTWHFLEYAKHAREIWDILSRDAVAAGSIDKLVASLPRKPVRKTKAKQQWLFKPERIRAIDVDFLNFLDDARRDLASDLIRHNDRAALLEGTRLDEAVQRILDRLLFLRICEDRDIDTGRPLANILRVWRGRVQKPPPRKLRPPPLPIQEDGSSYNAAAKPLPPPPLWHEIVAHFRALDRRPPSHIPYFNGNLFKEHFSETLAVSDEWISGFLDEISDDESPYLFNVIPVEILGTIYERFLGKTVRPQGRGVTIEEKPEVRKAGGVYYTPRYIVDYIVEQTLGKLLEDKAPKNSLKLRVLDPACGSGSFLIRAFERLCEHWQTALMADERLRRKADCWTDPDTGDLHLTTDLKRRILTENIYGVDLDPGAVEVTQLSLYLKMLEGETRITLAKNRELFGSDTPLLPPLQDNIKCGNSLIASDFSLDPDDLIRVRAFDWSEGFRDIMKSGGFDVVIGNPPWGFDIDNDLSYYHAQYPETTREHTDGFKIFIDKASRLFRPDGYVSFIVPSTILRQKRLRDVRALLLHFHITVLLDLGENVFKGVVAPSCIFAIRRCLPKPDGIVQLINLSQQSNAEKTVALSGNACLGECVEQSSFQSNTDYDFVVLRRLHHVPVVSLGDFHELECKDAGINYQRVGSGMQTKGKSDLAERLLYEGPRKGKRDQMFWKGTDIDRYWTATETTRFCRPNYQEFIRANEVVRLNHSVFNLTPKILFRQTADHVIATIDYTGIWFGRSIIAIVPTATARHRIEYIAALLNSKYFRWIYNNIAQESGRVFAQVKLAKIKQLPIRPIDFSLPSDVARHDKLVSLVDKMLVLAPRLRTAESESERATLDNAVRATDRAIDQLVYELYGLTPDEIALVEGPTNA